MPGPSDLNLTMILRKQGCEAFANLIVEAGADKTFKENDRRQPDSVLPGRHDPQYLRPQVQEPVESPEVVTAALPRRPDLPVHVELWRPMG